MDQMANILPVEASDQLDSAAQEAAPLLKSMSNPQRLRLLCALLDGEKSVRDLEIAVSAPQAYVSNQLARLREDGLVSARREGRSMRYQLADDRVIAIIERLYEVFCAPSQTGR